MTSSGGATVYTPRVLALAVTLAEFPLTPELPLTAEASSRVCGSRVRMGLRPSQSGVIEDLGAQVTACAIGQAAAAIFLAEARGRSRGEIAEALSQLHDWFGGGALPPWPGFDAIAAAQELPARHAAIALPWKAALAALSNHDTPG